MEFSAELLVDWDTFERARKLLGNNFYRSFGYFEEDGARSIAMIVTAIREESATRLVLPAHAIKCDALHFGANRLAKLAAHLEYGARDYVELRLSPGDLIPFAAQVQPLFDETIATLKRAISPLQLKMRGS